MPWLPNTDELIILSRDSKTGRQKRKTRRLGELTQPLLTGEPRPRTVSKPSGSLQGSCGPLVHHNCWHTACQPRKEPLRGASAETLLTAGGQEETGSASLSQWAIALTTGMLNRRKAPSWLEPRSLHNKLCLYIILFAKTRTCLICFLRGSSKLKKQPHVNVCCSARSVGATIRKSSSNGGSHKINTDTTANKCDRSTCHSQRCWRFRNDTAATSEWRHWHDSSRGSFST